MPKPESRHFDFRQGLGTTKPEQSGNALPFEDFYDAVATNGALTRRKGMVRVARITPASGPFCGDFDATNDFRFRALRIEHLQAARLQLLFG